MQCPEKPVSLVTQVRWEHCIPKPHTSHNVVQLCSIHVKRAKSHRYLLMWRSAVTVGPESWLCLMYSIWLTNSQIYAHIPWLDVVWFQCVSSFILTGSVSIWHLCYRNMRRLERVCLLFCCPIAEMVECIHNAGLMRTRRYGLSWPYIPLLKFTRPSQTPLNNYSILRERGCG